MFQSQSELLVLALAFIAGCSLVFLVMRARRGAETSTKEPEVLPAESPSSVSPELPTSLVFGNSPHNPVVKISTVPVEAHLKLGPLVKPSKNPTVSRLSSVCQSVPSLLVAHEASGKQLYEVVINGQMVRAADGNGLRAFSMGPEGIKENARLFRAENLQNVVSAAAVFQIASVVVAQKHLADISRKLDEIKEGVQGISRFLDNQRKARIHATFGYLTQVHQAIVAGDLPNAPRIELERCEREMLEIQQHLAMEFQQKVDKKVEHTETVGTKELKKAIAQKIDELDTLVEDMSLCLKTRVAAWHVLSLFPGDAQLKAVRRIAIDESLNAMASLAPQFERRLSKEIRKMDSWFNWESTLDKRKDKLFAKVQQSLEYLKASVADGRTMARDTDSLLLENDRPTHLMMEFQGETFLGVREPIGQAALMSQ